MAFQKYAQFYDLFYKKKNYKKECDFLEALFSKYCNGMPKTILDLGCGTGNHMNMLIKRGYKVMGIDSSRYMLSIAKKKIPCNFLFQKKIQSFSLNYKFDVIICMFSVIDYILSERNLIMTFKNVRKHMFSRSLFIFDFWQAQAVNRYYSPKKKRIFIFNNKTLERLSTTEIFPEKRIAKINYTCIIKNGKLILNRFRERHLIRYFTIEEIADLLNKAGLKVIGIYPFMNIDRKIRKNTWDITIISKKT